MFILNRFQLRHRARCLFQVTPTPNPVSSPHPLNYSAHQARVEEKSRQHKARQEDYNDSGAVSPFVHPITLFAIHPAAIPSCT